MIPLNAQMSALLATQIRAPKVYLGFDVPVQIPQDPNSYDFYKLGSQYLMQNVVSVRTVTSIDFGANTMDISFIDQTGQFSPQSGTAALGRYFFPGIIDNKVQLYYGLGDGSEEVVVPKGVFVVSSFQGNSEAGTNTVTCNMLDQLSVFKGTIYAEFPPRLYGNQTTGYYNPYYNLYPVNPSGGTATIWQCDAVNWMTASTQAPAYASDFVTPTLYVGTSMAPASLPYTGTATIYAALGQVVFGTAISTSSLVSVDARPLGMAPELMLYHLCHEFGYFDPAWYKFDLTGIIMPVQYIALDQAISDIAQQIVVTTAPRGIQWSFFFDEYGYIRFQELPLDGAPVWTFNDEYDLLRWQPEFSDKDLANVVRAESIGAINNQPLTVISIDSDSISIYGQRATYSVPNQYLTCTVGMDPGSAVAYLNGLCNSLLFQKSTPSIVGTASVLPNYNLQNGDVVRIVDSATGTDDTFYITQTTDQISGTDVSQELKLQQIKATQDFQFGIQSYTGAPLATNPNQVQTDSDIIETVTLQNGTDPAVTLVNNGQPVLDRTGNPVLFSWDGVSDLNYSIEIAAPPSTVTASTLTTSTFVIPAAVGDTKVVHITVGAPFPTGTAIFISDGTHWMYGTITSAGGTATPVVTLTSTNAYGATMATAANFSTNGQAQTFIWRYMYMAADPVYKSNTVGPLFMSGASAGTINYPTLYPTYDITNGLDTAASRRFYWPLLRPSDWLNNDGKASYISDTTLTSTWSGGIGAVTPHIYGNLSVGKSNYYGNVSSGYLGQALFAQGSPGAEILGLSSIAEYGVDYGPVGSTGSIYYNIASKTIPCYLGILCANTAGSHQFKRIQFQLAV